ncbi:hypothetical protein [Thetidibacter halocola]|uniref:Uncharacterized protein n=1 Tax=Thetidibacter halocola TaxID=2827239 RepID=A0A8J8B833_9RHOB|nr:hypothetical protein [Thetidibacter halocola]MBS0124155.1 hypothetical protein [Thetidibacter halocola]
MVPVSDAHWSRLCPQALSGFDPRLEVLRAVQAAGERAAGDAVAALLGLLHGALPQGLRLNPPGTDTRNFDEDWLLGLFAAQDRRDGSGYRFLLLSRLNRVDAARAHFRLVQARLRIEDRL